MKPKLSSIEANEAELEYRTKQYHVLRALKERELSCRSCGNVLSHESSEIFAHPVFGILQCRKCNDRAKEALASEEPPLSCLICAGTRKSLYKCERKSCSYKFCQACIKRNVPQSLTEAESKKWKCLVCSSRPLWKLRGACAAVMKSISKRTKRKKVSGHRSSDAEGDKSDLKNISYVRRRRLDETKKLSKRLSTVCDQDSPTDTERLESVCRRFNRPETKSDKIDGNKKHVVGHLGNENNALREEDKAMPTMMTSGGDDDDDDSDIQEIKYSRHKKTSKSSKPRDASTERRRKATSESRKDSTRDKNHGRRKNSADSRKSSSSNNDSDESETEKRSTSGVKRKHKSDNEISMDKKKHSSELDDNNENDEKRRRKKRRNESTHDRGKSVKTSTRETKKSSKTSKVDDDTNSSSTETRNSSKDLTSKRNGGSRKSRDDERSRKSRKDDSSSGSKNDNSDEIVATTRSSRDENDRMMHGKTKKSLDHRRVESQKFASDSSSGKEFCKSKLFTNSYVSLKRIAELDEDYTRTPDESSESPTDLISKDQTFALKNSVANFYAELKKAAKKLVNDIELAQTNYCTKDSMRATDVDRLILETRNVVTKLKRTVDHGENKVTDYYDKWCRKTRVRNVLKVRRTSDENDNAASSKRNVKRSPTKKMDSEKEVSPRGSPTSKKDEEIIRPDDKTTNLTVVSDCNSEEIFSGDEVRNSTRTSPPNSPTTSRHSEKSIEPVERSNCVEVFSSDDERVEDIVPSVPTSDCEPAPLDDRACELSSEPFAATNTLELPEKSILDATHLTRRDSVDPSDIDIFEATMESSEENSPNNKSVASISDTRRSSSTKEMPNSTRTRENKVSSRRESENDTSTKHRRGSSNLRRTSDGANPTIDEDAEEVAKSVGAVDEIDPTNDIDDNDNNDDAQTENDEITESFDSPGEKISKSKDHRDENDTEEIAKSPLNAEKSGDDEIQSRDEETSRYNTYDSPRNEEHESVHSVDTMLGEVSDDKHVSPSAIVSPEDDAEVATMDATTTNDRTSERDSSKSPSPRRTFTPDTLPDESVEHARDSSSPCRDKTKATIDESRSNSPILRDNDDPGQKIDEHARRSSVDTLITDNLTPQESAVKLISNISSRSSTPSESEDLRAREMLLQSSNSDESSFEDSATLANSGTIENEDAPPTPPESDSNSPKSTTRNRSEAAEAADITEKSPKTKRKKFRIQNYPQFMADNKLRQRCEIRLIRLKKRVLERYARALKKSRDYVDSKELKSLVSLNNLDKKKKSGKSDDNESDDDSTTGSLRSKRKERAAKEREETLLDHLEKVKNGKTAEEQSGDQSESDRSGRPEESGKDKSDDHIEESLFDEADRMAKKRLLESSDSGAEEPSASEAQDNEDAEKKEEKSKKVTKKDKADKTPEEQEKNPEKGEKSRWRKNKILTLKISDSDSEEDEKKFNLSQKKLAEKEKNKGSDSDSEEEKTPKKKRVRRRVLHSDSDVDVSPPSESENSDDDTDEKKKKKKKKGSSDEEAKKKTRKRIRRGNRSSSSSDSMGEKRPKNRRKRIKTAASDSDSDLENSQGTPGKSGRKNIRKVIRDKQVADDTKQAAKDEEERLQRIADRQKLYNQMYENRLAGETKVDKLVLDFDEETQEPLISVNEDLVKRLKPHQAQGIKFMWDACFESLERAKTTKGSGCILAHCMGLGKSFQVVALSHTLLQHEETGVKTIMVVCPLSTVLNWVNEFKMWLENLEDGDDIEVYELTRMKKNFERKYQLQRWQKTGGVLIIGYEMFRNLSNSTKKVRKNIQEAFLKCLVDPGADLIVCDEGHLLKNEDTALSKAMRRVKTLRRIVLTGTPLQNNLIEYHCMVQFVKPNLLGTKKEFTNRFENPITNGQFDDSTEYDVRLMKKRAHVLHKMLEGSVQRLDYSVLTPFLPPKQEYVIFVKLTDIQIRMYRHYLDNYARRHRGVGGSLFADFQALQRIWTHPLVMQMNRKKVELANEKKRLDATDSEGSLRDFIDDNSDSDTSDSSEPRSVSGSDDGTAKKPNRVTRSCPAPEEPPANQEKIEETTATTTTNDELDWWTEFVKDEDYEDISISSKLLLLFSILKESHTIGDKVLVFSQSLYSLSLIEEFLRLIDDATHSGKDAPENLDGHSGSWSLGLDYFRLDGQTTTDNRRRWCDIFNRPSNTRARLFLISTRAGGLGINLTAANRVIIFDASWNPSHDVQSIFRIYRFGQKKPCYVYRLLAAGTMEEKIYNRQVTKLSLSCRVVDEQQIERHYTNNALAELYKLEISEIEETLNLPKDRLLAEIFLKYKHCVENYHEHDSLLENQTGEELDEDERQQAWLEYEEEKKGKRMIPQVPFMTYQNEIMMQQMNLINMAQQTPAITNPAMMLDYENLKQMMSKDYPGVSEAQQKAMAERAVYEMYNYVERQAMAHQNPMGMMTGPVGTLGYDNRMGQQQQQVLQSHPTPDMFRAYQQSLIQQSNGQMNYPINQVSIIDPQGHIRNSPIVQKTQLNAQSLATSSSNVDDDIVEIPSSPEKNLVAPAPAPGGSRKSQEE